MSEIDLLEEAIFAMHDTLRNPPKILTDEEYYEQSEDYHKCHECGEYTEKNERCWNCNII
jgi:hypothetical protein